MPQTARTSVGGLCYHVINRGNARQEVFRNDGGYHAFLNAKAHASIEVLMRVLAITRITTPAATSGRVATRPFQFKKTTTS